MRLSETLEIDNNFLFYFADGMDLLHKSPESQFWGIVSIGRAARRGDNGRGAGRLLCDISLVSKVANLMMSHKILCHQFLSSCLDKTKHFI